MINISMPFDNNKLQQLKAGDLVLLSGYMYIARDAAHKKMINEGVPFSLQNECIYYCGPTEAVGNSIIGSAGPTTSSRMDAFAPYLYDMGLKATIGKGKRSQQLRQSIIKNKSVYFGAIGGLGAKLSKHIKAQEIIAYEDLGPEAVRKIYVENFPVLVIIDSNGNTLY